MFPHLIDPLDFYCDDCNAQPGEPCRPYCTGLAAAQETKESLE